MTTITREWLQQTIAEFENTRDDIPFGLSDDGAKILIVLKRALASLEREQVRHEHAEWSDATFGDVGPIGPLKHLSKEALEAAADPSDPLEWADMQFLLWDAQRRMGLSDEFITRAMIEKLEINKSRQWPEPKDGESRLHIKEQLAPVVPPAIEPDYEVIKSILPTANPDEYACCIAADMWNACRAAMLQGAEPVSQTYELPELIEGMEVSVDVSTCDFDAGHRYFGTVTEVSELDTAKNGYILLVQDAEPNFKTAGNSPVAQDGWISCSERMPDNDESKPIAIFTGKCLGQGMFVATYDDDGFFDYWVGMEIIGVTHWMPLPEPPQEVK
ncbi:dATP/dGTP pyrophosphohydrolase domain-containing protein [Salmonella enterica]